MISEHLLYMPSIFLSVLLTIKFTSHNHPRDKCYCYLPGVGEGTEAKGIEETCRESRSPWAPRHWPHVTQASALTTAPPHLRQAVQSKWRVEAQSSWKGHELPVHQAPVSSVFCDSKTRSLLQACLFFSQVGLHGPVEGRQKERILVMSF